MPLADYQKMLQDARGHQLMYLEDFTDGEDDDYLERHTVGVSNDNPLELLMDQSMRVTLVNAIEDLPEREKMVMGMYYEEDLNLREIGEVLGVSNRESASSTARRSCACALVSPAREPTKASSPRPPAPLGGEGLSAGIDRSWTASASSVWFSASPPSWWGRCSKAGTSDRCCSPRRS